MAVLNFPTGYNLERRSRWEWSRGVELDVLDDGTSIPRQLTTVPTVTLSAKFDYLSQSEADTLESFVLTSGTDAVLWTIDGTPYIGYFKGNLSKSMVGNRYNVSFTYYAQEFSF